LSYYSEAIDDKKSSGVWMKISNSMFLMRIN